MNKKIIIPLFSTIAGLSLIGGTSGAVAWYQYNTRVTTSFVGTSVADSGILQIGYKANSTSPISWGRDKQYLLCFIIYNTDDIYITTALYCNRSKCINTTEVHAEVIIINLALLLLLYLFLDGILHYYFYLC